MPTLLQPLPLIDYFLAVTDLWPALLYAVWQAREKRHRQKSANPEKATLVDKVHLGASTWAARSILVTDWSSIISLSWFFMA